MLTNLGTGYGGSSRKGQPLAGSGASQSRQNLAFRKAGSKGCNKDSDVNVIVVGGWRIERVVPLEEEKLSTDEIATRLGISQEQASTFTETWKPIIVDGHDTGAQLSDVGRFKTASHDADSGKRTLFTPIVDGDGDYARVGLKMPDGSHKKFLFHRCVLTAFEGPPPIDEAASATDGKTVFCTGDHSELCFLDLSRVQSRQPRKCLPQSTGSRATTASATCAGRRGWCRGRTRTRPTRPLPR